MDCLFVEIFLFSQFSVLFPTWKRNRKIEEVCLGHEGLYYQDSELVKDKELLSVPL